MVRRVSSIASTHMKLFTVILVLVLCSSSSFAQNIFNVKASATGGATSWTLLGFYPSALTVGQGDTVQFSVDGEVRDGVLISQ